MSLKSLLAASLFVAVCSAPLTAQTNRRSVNIAEAASATPTPKADNVLRVPALSSATSTGSAAKGPILEAQAGPAPKMFVLPKGAKMAQQGTSGSAACFTLRERRFRAPADGSAMPVPSGSVTCTETSEVRLRNAEMQPAIVQAAPAK